MKKTLQLIILFTIIVLGIFFYNTYLKKDQKVENTELINSEDVENILNGGHEIGAHTHEHHTLADMKMDDFVKDVSRNSELLSNLNVIPKTLARTFGMRRSVTNEQIKYHKANFDCIV